MRDEAALWLGLYALYVVVCAALLALIHRRDRARRAVRFVFAAALPVVGFWLARFRPPEKAGRHAEHALPEDEFLTADLKAPDDEIRLHLDRAENARAKDAVPLEEALLVADVPVRRRMLLSLLGRDAPTDSELLGLAVRNDDTETSHYAVSVILERKRKWTLALQELSARYAKTPHDPDVLRAYAEALQEYMASGFLDAASLRETRQTLAEVLERLVGTDPDARRYFADLVDVQLALQRLDRAGEAAEEFVRRYPETEAAYLALLKVGYARWSQEAIRTALKRLADAPVRLSGEALAMVRFWRGGADDPIVTPES